MGKKYEATSVDRKRMLTVHNVDHDDVGIYECMCDGDKMSVQLSLKGEASNFSLHLLSFFIASHFKCKIK